MKVSFDCSKMGKIKRVVNFHKMEFIKCKGPFYLRRLKPS